MRSIVKIFNKNLFVSLFVLLSVLVLFILNNIGYLDRTTFSTIISQHQWQNFSAYKNKKLFAHQKLKGEFKATNNRLGTVDINLKIFQEDIFDSLILIFKIREKDSQDWYYQSEHNNIIYSDIFFPFGFPVIENSKNKTYEIEIESVNGTEQNAFALSSEDPYFLSKYDYPKNYLQQDKSKITAFIFGKISSFIASFTFISLINYLFILFFSFSFSIIQIFTKSKNRKRIIAETQKIFITFSNIIWLLIIGIIITLFYFKNSGALEALEWSMYQTSAIGVVLVAFIFGYFFKNKISVGIFRKLLNFYTVSFGSLVLLLLLTSSINIRHLLFLSLASIPLIKYYYRFPGFLTNLIAILAVLSYFNIDFPKFSPSRILIIIFITIILYFASQSRFKFIKTSLKIPTWILLLVSLPIIFYITQKPINYHHYSFYIGPVLDVIKDKSLLGETPSQYGYLSIHFLAFILKRIGISFANFNLVNILLFIFYFFLASLILFKLIKNKLYAFFTSLIIISLQTIFSYYYTILYPSTGPLRFGLGLIIIFILTYFSSSIGLFLSSIIASIALFWSIETAVYIIPAWLAACLIFSYSSTNSFKEFFKSSIRKLSFFGITTVIIFSLIILKEYSIQHAFPRISDYFEYAMAYKDSHGTLLIPAYGNFYPIVLIMILGVVAIAYILTNKIKTKLLPLFVFIAIHNIALFSYFVSRSHENNIVNITSFAILELIIIFKILTNVLNINIPQLKRTINLPIFLFLVMFSFRLYDRRINLYPYIQNSYQQNMADWFNPKSVKPVLITALEKHNLKNNPIVLLSLNQDTGLLVESNLKNELSLNPAEMAYVLKDTWRDKYINPNLEKLTIGTVIIVDANRSNSFLGPVFNDIQNIYDLKEIGIIFQENLIIYQIISIKKV